MPLKIIIIPLVALWHEVDYFLNWERGEVGSRIPSRLDFEEQSHQLEVLIKQHLVKGDGKFLKGSVYIPRAHLPNAFTKIISDHQALRQGSLCWAMPDKDIIEGLSSFILWDEFKRGVVKTEPVVHDDKPCPPAMAMSVAFGIKCGLRAGVKIPLHLQRAYLRAVDKLIENDFKLADSSSEMRLLSNGFDAIYVLSMLHVAYELSNEPRFKSFINSYLLTHSCLLISPITWFKSRAFFIDHISSFGLWTCYQSCRSSPLKKLYRHSLRFIWNQSAKFTNPYMTALAYECDAITNEERLYCLRAHADASALGAIKIRPADTLHVHPIDYTMVYGDEFKFDDTPKGRPIPVGMIEGENYLNGLVLAQSLIRLMT